MDWRDFIASLVGSLAWPAAVLVLVLVLRAQVAELLGGPLRRLKVGPGGAELEWDRTADQVAASSVRALPHSTQDDGLDAELDNLERIAEQTPAVAIAQAFAVVERELRRAVEEGGVEIPGDDRRPRTLIKAAYVGGTITKEPADALRGLVELRDLAAHDPSGTRVTPEKAAEYLTLVRAVLYALRAGKS